MKAEEIKEKLKGFISEQIEGRSYMAAGSKLSTYDYLVAYQNAVQDFYEWLDESVTQDIEGVKASERPRVNHFFENIAAAHADYTNAPTLFRYTQALDNYIDELESGQQDHVADVGKMVRGYNEQHKGWVALFKDEDEYTQYLKWRQQAPEPVEVDDKPVWVKHLGKEVVFGFEGRKKKGIVEGYHPQYGVVLFVPSNTMISYHYVREELIEWLDKSTPAPIICTGCGKSFNNVGTLDSHKPDCSKQSPEPAFFCLNEEDNGKKLRCENQCESCKQL